MHYGMAIDLKRCIGCHTCAMACKAANNIPEGVWWNRVLTDGGAVSYTHLDVYKRQIRACANAGLADDDIVAMVAARLASKKLAH